MCIYTDVTRKIQVTPNGQKGRLKRKLHYHCTRNLSFHQNNTQDLTVIFLVTVILTKNCYHDHRTNQTNVVHSGHDDSIEIHSILSKHIQKWFTETYDQVFPGA